MAGTLRVGTSSWSSGDWKGVFYPKNARPESFLGHYAGRFDTVECDATFYRIPSVSMVSNWHDRTPDDFLLSAKLPREITHDRGMVGCDDLVSQFLTAMEPLGEKRGPLVAQFPYIAKGKDAAEYETGDDFRNRLDRFLEKWPLEVIAPPLMDLLRRRDVPLVFPVYYTMPGAAKLFSGTDPVTSDLMYVRFLGDHKRMDALVARLKAEGKRSGDWSEPALDRDDEMRSWARELKLRSDPGSTILAYFNNHYAGFGPGSADHFLSIWQEDS
ncbi:MAG: DUF72 domain-containing protein [Acidobacteria bacterium]|uniref:DUF72 domain-containing protein n=1 Tax=Candidatus Polarisedimenticola svalbardensis TaxID=2886004 RepID=A0A8J7CLX0_9BACT|nr:DUF72 domain-containing protein [Candidatus Polarisedimenticola svalbardensis]